METVVVDEMPSARIHPDGLAREPGRMTSRLRCRCCWSASEIVAVSGVREVSTFIVVVAHPDPYASMAGNGMGASLFRQLSLSSEGPLQAVPSGPRCNCDAPTLHDGAASCLLAQNSPHWPRAGHPCRDVTVPLPEGFVCCELAICWFAVKDATAVRSEYHQTGREPDILVRTSRCRHQLAYPNSSHCRVRAATRAVAACRYGRHSGGFSAAFKLPANDASLGGVQLLPWRRRCAVVVVVVVVVVVEVAGSRAERWASGYWISRELRRLICSHS